MELCNSSTSLIKTVSVKNVTCKRVFHYKAGSFFLGSEGAGVIEGLLYFNLDSNLLLHLLFRFSSL